MITQGLGSSSLITQGLGAASGAVTTVVREIITVISTLYFAITGTSAINTEESEASTINQEITITSNIELEEDDG